MEQKKDERELLTRRLADLSGRAAGGMLTVSTFLTPRERCDAEGWLRARAYRLAFFDGGYEEAERTRLFFLPGYLDGVDEDSLSAQERLENAGETLEDYICALKIKGSGYHVLAHRNFLGSVLGLGIKREACGDLCLLDEHSAVIFCDRRMAVFLNENLTRVGADAVKTEILSPNKVKVPKKQVRPIQETVASPRLDAVVAALTGLSRERAQQMVTAGLVELNFIPELRTDATVTAPSQLSVRGYGRYAIRACSDETKKGRLRLLADRYI